MNKETLSDAERQLLAMFRALDTRGQRNVFETARFEYDRELSERKKTFHAVNAEG